MGAIPTIPTRSNGQVIDQTWFNLLKTICDDVFDRLGLLQNEFQYIYFTANSLLDHLSLPSSAVFTIPIDDDITVVDCQLVVFAPGGSGTLEAGIEYKRGAGSWTSVLTTRPTVGYASGAVTTTNGVVDPLQDQLDAGDLLRLNIQQLQPGIRNWALKVAYQRR